MSTVVGVDVGGSKTHGLLVTDGRTVAESVVGSANIKSVGAAEAALQLSLLARELLGPVAAVDAVDAVCVGGAGADSALAAARMRPLVEAAFPGAPVRIVHDTHVVLAAAGLGEGVVIISGTGSAAWARDGLGRELHTGGWGYLLGDEGSGWGIARAALRHALGRLDAGEAPDELTGRLLAECGVTGAGDLLEFFYRSTSRREWAARAGLVLDLAAAGDAVAGTIVDGAAAELVQAVTRVAARLGLTGPVVMAGGLLVNRVELRRRVEAELTASGLKDLRVLDRDPVHGAVTLALEMV